MDFTHCGELGVRRRAVSTITRGRSGERSISSLFLPPLNRKMFLARSRRNRRNRLREAPRASCLPLRCQSTDRQRARLDAGDVQQVADQITHAVSLLHDDPEELPHLSGVQVRGGDYAVVRQLSAPASPEIPTVELPDAVDLGVYDRLADPLMDVSGCAARGSPFPETQLATAPAPPGLSCPAW